KERPLGGVIRGGDADDIGSLGGQHLPEVRIGPDAWPARVPAFAELVTGTASDVAAGDDLAPGAGPERGGVAVGDRRPEDRVGGRAGRIRGDPTQADERDAMGQRDSPGSMQ